MDSFRTDTPCSARIPKSSSVIACVFIFKKNLFNVDNCYIIVPPQAGKYNAFFINPDIGRIGSLNLLEKRQNLHRQSEAISLEKQELRDQIQSLQGQAVLGRAWAMAAHEINNLLSPLSSYAQLAMQHRDDPALVDKALKKAVDSGKKIEEILRQIPELAGRSKSEKITVTLDSLVQQVFSALGRDFSRDGIKVTQDVDPELTIYVNPVGLRQVLMNLILNAREAMLQRGGRLTIRSRRVDNAVEIDIADTGCGVPPDQLDKLFEPFFTTKTGDDGQRKGNGIGLAYCKQVIEDHNGRIGVRSVPQQGTTFTILLPKTA